jgi:hypothetical protein
MTSSTQPDLPRMLVASTPGGLACQFRVQHRTPSGEWHLFGTFHDRTTAHVCLADLQARGLEVRLVAVRICPFSA